MVTSAGRAQHQLSHAIEIVNRWVEKNLADAFTEWSTPGLSRMSHLKPHILYESCKQLALCCGSSPVDALEDDEKSTMHLLAGSNNNTPEKSRHKGRGWEHH
jgi:hypothetical protein